MHESTEKLLNETYKVLREAAEEDDFLAERIGGTESLTCYEISCKHPEEIKWEFDKNGVKYFSTPANRLILVSRDEKTLRRCHMVERKTLLKKGGYAIEMDYEDLAASIAGNPEIDDKELIAVSGLTREAASKVIEGCKRVSPGIPVGVKEEKQTVTLFFPRITTSPKCQERLAQELLSAVVKTSYQMSEDLRHATDISYYERLEQEKIAQNISREALSGIEQGDKNTLRQFLREATEIASYQYPELSSIEEIQVYTIEAPELVKEFERDLAQREQEKRERDEDE